MSVADAFRVFDPDSRGIPWEVATQILRKADGDSAAFSNEELEAAKALLENKEGVLDEGQIVTHAKNNSDVTAAQKASAWLKTLPRTGVVPVSIALSSSHQMPRSCYCQHRSDQGYV